MNITRKVELLAPAGDLECIKAAINAGADAVYTGGDKFGARAFANNLNKDELIEAINYAHIHEAFIYLTVNTLLKDDEIKKDLYDYILPLYEAGLDAVIVQDMGVFKFIKDNFKNLDIHISTQSTINGKRTAKKYKELGASRVVTPRELSLEGIKDISENVDIEIESFIHGALCYCYSGMCLLSSVIGGRSGNRGRCAQPCRKDYVFEEHKSTLLSTKDMCTIKILPEIINSGVYSLKIEGRMKKPTYVAGVVSIYRKYIDYYLSNKDSIDSGKMKYEVKDDDYNNLLDLFNRNGFNESYYKIHCDKSMMSLTKPKFRAENKSLTDYLNKSFIENNKREDLIIDVVIKKDTPIKVKVTALRKYEEYIITEFESITPDLAINRELDANEVEKQLSKLGNTLYIAKEINVNLESGLFLSVGNLKQLKRECVDRITEIINQKYVTNRIVDYKFENKLSKDINNFNKLKDLNNGKNKDKRLRVLVNDFNQLENIIELDIDFDIYVEDFIFEKPEIFYKYLKMAHSRNKKIYYACIRFLHFEKEKMFMDSINELINNDIDGFLIRSYEEYFIINNIIKNINKNLDLIFDNTIYTFNSYSFNCIDEFISENKELFNDENINKSYNNLCLTYPLELRYEQIKNLISNYNEELVVYGKMPVMVSANCVIRNTKGCSHKCEKGYIKDDLNNKFQIATNCRYCQNTIYNSVPTSLYGVFDKVLDINNKYLRLEFTDEGIEEIIDIITSYARLLYSGEKSDNIFFENNNFTRGHFLRGVK